MENEKGIVKLTRKQLYDEIWALSVAGVARKYNLNYGKLIATCKVENISFPCSIQHPFLFCNIIISQFSGMSINPSKQLFMNRDILIRSKTKTQVMCPTGRLVY